MPTRNVNLSTEQAEFIQKTIDTGGFRNASEVIRAGLRLLEQEQELNRLKLKRLRAVVKEGFDAIDDGDYEMVTQDGLGKFLASVSAVKRRNKSA
jgi:antitoxin ParD1/3/4